MRTYTVCNKCGCIYNEDKDCYRCDSINTAKLTKKTPTKPALTQKRLKELLRYNKGTGKFTRLIRVMGGGPNANIGDIVGTYRPDGYLLCGIDNNAYRLHRLAFLYVEGYFPEHGVDHINGIRDDNAWGNLRHATQACNLQNQKINIRNTSGFPGVNKHLGKWRARCQLNGKSIHLGLHKTKIDAALAKLTFETWCKMWTCNSRSELVDSIKHSWPEFNSRCLL